MSRKRICQNAWFNFLIRTLTFLLFFCAIYHMTNTNFQKINIWSYLFILNSPFPHTNIWYLHVARFLSAPTLKQGARGWFESLSRSQKTSLFQNITTVNISGSLTKLTLLSFLFFLINMFVLMNSKIDYGFGNLHDNIWASSDILQFWDSSYRKWQ